MKLEWICECTVHYLGTKKRNPMARKSQQDRLYLMLQHHTTEPGNWKSANTLMLHGFDFGVVITYRFATLRLMGSLQLEFTWGTTFCPAFTF